MYKKISGLVVSLTAVFACAAWAEVPAGYPADYQKTIDAAVKEGKVVIYSTTDTKAAGPLIKGFEAQYPGVKVEYNDMNSTELYNRYISEQAAGGGSGDVVWSSSMDTALKLATEYAEQYASPEVKQLPDWAVWQQKAYGTTYELSEKGQQILASQADIPSIRRDIAGKNDIDGMTALLGKALKPIPVNETLLDYLQPQKRLQFIKQWRSAAAK